MKSEADSDSAESRDILGKDQSPHISRKNLEYSSARFHSVLYVIEHLTFQKYKFLPRLWKAAKQWSVFKFWWPGVSRPGENSPRGAWLNLISRNLCEWVIPQTHNQKLCLFISLSKCVAEVFKHTTQNGWIIQMVGIQKGNPSNWNFRTVTQLFAPFTRKPRV